MHPIHENSLCPTNQEYDLHHVAAAEAAAAASGSAPGAPVAAARDV